jgi:thioredoxin reductase (NADPH)
MNMSTDSNIYDCIVIGAGPGGLQSALHLARFNRDVLVIDRGGGRTRHAKHIENYLGYSHIKGSELIDTGLSQIKRFGVKVIKAKAEAVAKKEYFSVQAQEREYRSKFLIGATGARENLPNLKNLGSYFSDSVFTCVACDGYRTTGKKLVILGNSAESIRVALGMKQMYTDDITLIMSDSKLPQGASVVLAEENIRLVQGKAEEILGDENLTGVMLDDSTLIEAQVVMLSLGATLNDSYLKDLELQRNEGDGKYLVNAHFESSLSGLYLTGALCQGHAQAIIAAGQGAVAAIDINRRLLGV